MFSAENRIHMERVEAIAPHLFLWKPPNKGEESNSQETWQFQVSRGDDCLPRVQYYREVKIFSHSMAIKPRIITIVAQFPPINGQ